MRRVRTVLKLAVLSPVTTRFQCNVATSQPKPGCEAVAHRGKSHGWREARGGGGDGGGWVLGLHAVCVSGTFNRRMAPGTARAMWWESRGVGSQWKGS